MFGELGLLLVAIGAIALVAGFLHSAIGFGFGIVAISLLPFVIDARSAHVVVSISSVPMLIMAAWTYREGIEKRSLALALLGAAIFLPLGLRLFESVSLDLLVRGTGLGILVMVILSLRRVEFNARCGLRWTFLFRRRCGFRFSRGRGQHCRSTDRGVRLETGMVASPIQSVRDPVPAGHVDLQGGFARIA